MQYSADADEAREIAREMKQYAKISDRFRVLMPSQIDELLEKSEAPLVSKENGNESPKQAQSPNTALKNKKRKRDEMLGISNEGHIFGLNMTEETRQLQAIMNNLKQRVL